MEITNEIKAKVMSAYIGQKVTTPVRTYEKRGKKSQYIDGVFKEIDLGMSDFMGVLLDNEADECNYKYFNPNESQLILKPLSEITDEHAIEVAKIIKPEATESQLKDSVEFKDGFVEAILSNNDEIYFEGASPLKVNMAYQYLQSQGYDMPNYLLNGQTLQQAGIAVYKTKTT